MVVDADEVKEVGRVHSLVSRASGYLAGTAYCNAADNRVTGSAGAAYDKSITVHGY